MRLERRSRAPLRKDGNGVQSHADALCDVGNREKDAPPRLRAKLPDSAPGRNARARRSFVLAAVSFETRALPARPKAAGRAGGTMAGLRPAGRTYAPPLTSPPGPL